jgi:EF-hand domain-containing family member B
MPRNLGQTKRLTDPNIVFGVNHKPDDEWHAKELLRGDPTFKEAYNDPSLGRATRHGFRNRTIQGDETRSFGVPTIRNDVKAPHQISVSCTQNYGNESTAVE